LGELLSRFRYPLSYLTLGLLCIIGMTGERTPAQLGIGSRVLLEIAVPLQQMITLPVHEIRSVWRDYVTLVGVREENETLRGEIARLKDENLQYREAVVSAERFKELENLRMRRDFRMLPANVAAQDLSAWFQSIIIDQGGDAGIQPGMAVVNEEGVVGVILGTTPGASKVLLIVDSQSSVDGYVQRSRARGTLHGSSERGCSFEYVLRDQDVEVGDLLLTSGLGAIYPKGLPIGRVRSVDRKPYGLFQLAEVEPMVDFRQLEEVFVILDRPQLPEAEAFATDEESLWTGGTP